MKRLSLKRRPRGALNNVENTQSSISSDQWLPAESLSSSGSGSTRLLGMSSSTKGKPPLPPSHGSLLDNKSSKSEDPSPSQILTESKPRQPERYASPQRQNPVVERMKNSPDQDLTSRSPPQPLPRRRLASFGGVSTPGSHSPFTGLGAYNQNNNGNKPATETNAHLSSSVGSRGSTGCLRVSPQSSGTSTPLSSFGSMHLQHVRDQMVLALEKLRELEEQVKIIPILQVKISVLQEEKRHLLSQLKDQTANKDTILKGIDNLAGSDLENGVNTVATSEGTGINDCAKFKELKQLVEEMQALERTIRGGHLQMWHEKGHGPLQDKSTKSVAVGTMDTDMTSSKKSKENKYVYTDLVETKSIATEVTELHLGFHSKLEAELDAQRLLNRALKERIFHLEAELKESALKIELTCLKLELQSAGARNRVDKSCLARPSTVSISIEAKPSHKSQGVGNHIDLQDASTGEAKRVETVGLSCKPEMKSICTGPDVPINHWEVRQRMETSEKAVGIWVSTRTQGTGTETKLRDESNTEVPAENVTYKKQRIRCQSVDCGDYFGNACISEAKKMVSQSIATDLVRGVDRGITASPQTASRRTNTTSSSVSRFTNTSQAFRNDSSTNTLLSKQDKHTNTTHTFTRTVSVGNRIEGFTCATETRSVGVNTANLPESILKQTSETVSKVTRDCGVGFTNIYENFLVGLKTRNMASGPSHLPDPIKTKTIGVGEGRIRDFSVSSCTTRPRFQQSAQWDHELSHYIEKMHRLLKEHGDLLTEEGDHYSNGPLCNIKSVTEGGAEVHLVASQSTDTTCTNFKENPEISQVTCNESEVKKRIKVLELQSASALQDTSVACKPSSLKKKQGGDQSCSNNRKSMKFMSVTPGLDLMSAYEQEEEERKGNHTFKNSSKDIKEDTKKGSNGTLHQPPRCKLSEKMFSACQALKIHLSEDPALSSRELQDSLRTLQQEWFSISSHKAAAPNAVGEYLSTFQMISPSVLHYITNMTDGNGNTALHYSVSHSNFGIVKKLLDAGVCNVNQQNAAGYTPIMLAALAAVADPKDMRVVQQLFAKGDVNAKASQAGQTALMLAVSHGRMDMVQPLLALGAEVNIQDDEGSTALMCASEHGHVDIVKLLLAQPDCDATLTDSDESTALSIALEAGHHDIAVLLYAHANFSRHSRAGARHTGRCFVSSEGGNIFE
nr:KN motif and ankyrin repeat domain-containing protein 1 [Nothobranchius furzeri]